MTTTNNLTHPGLPPVNGDQLQIIHDNGGVEYKTYWYFAPDPPSIAALQAAQKALIQAGYETSTNMPVPYTTAAGVTAQFPAGDTIIINGKTAKQNLSDIIDAGSAAWTINAWLDINTNVVTPFTFSDIQGLAAEIEKVDSPDYLELLAKFAAINAATDEATIQSIVWS